MATTFYLFGIVSIIYLLRNLYISFKVTKEDEGVHRAYVETLKEDMAQSNAIPIFTEFFRLIKTPDFIVSILDDVWVVLGLFSDEKGLFITLLFLSISLVVLRNKVPISHSIWLLRGVTAVRMLLVIAILYLYFYPKVS